MQEDDQPENNSTDGNIQSPPNKRCKTETPASRNLCQQCGRNEMGQTDNNGIFYCFACWDDYDLSVQ